MNQEPTLTGSAGMACSPSFVECVQRHKAVEWLMANDPMVRRFANAVNGSVVESLLFAAEFGEQLREKISAVATTMEVTDQERSEGYPLPRDDRERAARAQMKLDAFSVLR